MGKLLGEADANSLTTPCTTSSPTSTGTLANSGISYPISAIPWQAAAAANLSGRRSSVDRCGWLGREVSTATHETREGRREAVRVPGRSRAGETLGTARTATTTCALRRRGGRRPVGCRRRPVLTPSL